MDWERLNILKAKAVRSLMPDNCSGTNITRTRLAEVFHEIGVWGIENNIAVTKIDKLKNIIFKHFG